MGGSGVTQRQDAADPDGKAPVGQHLKGVPDAEIAWTVLSPLAQPPIGHVYGDSLRPVDGGTAVTSYCDWSNIDPIWRDREIPGVGTVTWPVVPATALRATLGILERTVTRPA